MSQKLLQKRKTSAVAAASKAALKTAKKLVREHKKHQRQNNTQASSQVVAKVASILGLYVAFDFEWDDKTHVLLAASFVDSNGKKQVILNTGSELKLIQKIISVLLQYKVSIGWNTSTSIESNDNYTFIAPTTTNNEDSNYDDEAAETNGYSINLDTKCDVGILDERLNVHGLYDIRKKLIHKHHFGSKVYYGFNGFKHIDLYQVFEKLMVKDTILKRAYRTLKLNDVAVALLHIGKYKSLSGQDFAKLSVKDKKAYSLRDSELVMQLSQYDNYKVLDAMNEIAIITDIPFERVCRTNLTTWWAEIFNKMIANGEAPKPFNVFNSKLTKYRGALVLAPTKGYYDDGAIMVDVASLYPTMAIVYNLSYETVNCRCCRDDKKARVKFADDKFYDGCKYLSKDNFWICRKIKQGAFAQKLKIFREQKLKHARLGLEASKRNDKAAEIEHKAKELAFKILINGGYGCFGSQQFRYFNPLVAEAITTFGRYTLSKMQTLARKYGYEIRYGDTDSLVLSKTAKASDESMTKFIARCNKDLQVELEVKRIYDKLILSEGKKHYLGIGIGEKNTEVFDIVGFEGKRSDRCEYIQQVFNTMVNNILRHKKDPLPDIRKAVADLKAKKVNPELLKKAIRLNQEVHEYKNKNNKNVMVGQTLGLRKGELAEFYDANKKRTGKSWSFDPEDIDIDKYTQDLWNTLQEVLELVGYSKEELAKEFTVKVVIKKKNVVRKNLVVVVSTLEAVRKTS